MSTNCIVCVVNKRTGGDLMCDSCRSSESNRRYLFGNLEAEEERAKLEAQSLCDHEWKPVDDSFDHEYGCEQIHYWRCDKCELTKPREAADEE